MNEVHMYLRITKSEMTVDLFDYDYWVNCLAEFVIRRSNINIPVKYAYHHGCAAMGTINNIELITF